MSGRFTEPAATMETCVAASSDLCTCFEACLARCRQHPSKEFSSDKQWQSIEEIRERLGQEVSAGNTDGVSRYVRSLL